jgi:Reductase C-terminal
MTSRAAWSIASPPPRPGIQTVGSPVLGDSSRLAEGDPRRGRFVVTHHRDGQLVGAVAVDSPRRLLHYRDLIGAHREQPASTGRGRAVDLSTADRAPLADRAAS